MNAINITDPEIESYLLGTAESELAEAIDELTFIDDEFAARVGSVERDLVDEYLRKELDHESVRQFESYYMQSPKRREKVRLGAALDDFIVAAAASMEHPIRAEPAVENKPTWIGAWWKFALPLFAAAILLAVAIPLWFGTSSTQQQANINANTNSDQLASVQPTAQPTSEPSIHPTASPTAVESPGSRDTSPVSNERQADPPAPRVFAISLSPQLRGSQGEPTFSIPHDTRTVSVTLRLEPTEFSSVLVELREKVSGRRVWQRLVRPSASRKYQSVNFRFPHKLVAEGRYAFFVTGVSATTDAEIIGEYPFRVSP